MADAGVVAFLETRLALFFLLQRAYAAPIGADLTGTLRETTVTYGALLDLEWGGSLPDAGPEDEPEFFRLFVGPGRLVAPPYESVYLSPEGVLMQEETEAVRAFYQAYGLEVRAKYCEPDDALSLELEFYSRLQKDALAAYQAGDGAEAARLLAGQRQFHQEHLSRWVEPFSQRVLDGSANLFYRTLAIVTREVVKAEEQVIASIAAVLS